MQRARRAVGILRLDFAAFLIGEVAPRLVLFVVSDGIELLIFNLMKLGSLTIVLPLLHRPSMKRGMARNLVPLAFIITILI